MAVTLFKTSKDLSKVPQEFIDAAQLEDPLFKHLPIVNKNSHEILWDQKDNYRGRMQARGMNGESPRVRKIGGRRFKMEPAVFGEHAFIPEDMLTKKSSLGTFGDIEEIQAQIDEDVDMLSKRQVRLIKYLMWTLLTTGTLNVLGPAGQLLYAETYDFQDYAPASHDWDSLTTAEPIIDLQNIREQGHGYGVTFDGKAEMFMRTLSINKLVNNQNAADINGKRVGGGNTVNTLAEANRILLDANLPQIVPMDETYYDDNNTLQYYLPEGLGVLIGAREDGESLGEYQITRNANNPGGKPGPYQKVLQNIGPDATVPPWIKTEIGHNGGLVIWYPNSILLFTAYTP